MLHSPTWEDREVTHLFSPVQAMSRSVPMNPHQLITIQVGSWSHRSLFGPLHPEEGELISGIPTIWTASILILTRMRLCPYILALIGQALDMITLFSALNLT